MGTVASIFDQLPYGDPDALADFLAAHHQSHLEINAYLATQGIALHTPDLSGRPDPIWFSDHAVLHSAINRALQTPGSPGLYNRWRNAGAFYEWHRINADEHSVFAQKTGVG